MILVDSSVWISHFRPGPRSPKIELLNDSLQGELVLIGDLIMIEVLQGFRYDKDFEYAKKLLSSLKLVRLGGKKIAIQAAKNYRTLRRLGITPRKTIDTVIATWCIENGSHLLHDDRDFMPFSQHLGLQVLDA
ncbi:type II toxin-antitoxin system VapC family toxin [Duganella sp. S19_KUP01_CR8]|uniref:type II toxin-antitoxin system VapC family toxin n=1 Tax=Duganella sp. S19_KUP01_CR8 TaxID=3025502 RepID=UPI002FCD9328